MCDKDGFVSSTTAKDVAYLTWPSFSSAGKSNPGIGAAVTEWEVLPLNSCLLLQKEGDRCSWALRHLHLQRNELAWTYHLFFSLLSGMYHCLFCILFVSNSTHGVLWSSTWTECVTESDWGFVTRISVHVSSLLGGVQSFTNKWSWQISLILRSGTLVSSKATCLSYMLSAACNADL